MVVALIILNVILIVLIAILMVYLFRNKNEKNTVKNVCTNNRINMENEKVEHKQNKKINSDRVFDGIVITDEEYQQMINSRRSDISILLEDVNREYEYLKRLKNERAEGNNQR
jgi:FtsZ-interacting cell division protein ZipA